jgi:hypothetical protein
MALILIFFRYASIGAVLMSKEVADGVRDGSGLCVWVFSDYNNHAHIDFPPFFESWKHGHTYQVGFCF